MNSLRIWQVAVTVGVTGALPIAFYTSTVPQLLIIPIVFGVVLLVVLEFAPFFKAMKLKRDVTRNRK